MAAYLDSDEQIAQKKIQLIIINRTLSMTPQQMEPMFDDIAMTPEARKVIQDYLERLSAVGSRLTSDDKQEIVRDIKEHLFTALETKLKKLKSKKDIIDAQIAMETLSDLGEPEDYLEITQTETGVKGVTPVRRLRRSNEGKVIAGVAAGIADYFRIDVAIVRLLFVLGIFAGCFSIIAYIVFWIALPLGSGETTQQADGQPGRAGVTFLGIMGKLAFLFFLFLLVVSIYLPVFLVLLVLTLVGLLGPLAWLFAPSGMLVVNDFAVFGLLTPVVLIAGGLISLFLLISFIALLGRLHFKRYLLRTQTIRTFGMVALISLCVIIASTGYAFASNRYLEKVTDIQSYPISTNLKVQFKETNWYGSSVELVLIGDEDTDELIIKEIKRARGISSDAARRQAEKIEVSYDLTTDTMTIDASAGKRIADHFQTVTYELTVPADLLLDIENPIGKTTIYDMDTGSIKAQNKAGILQIENSTALDIDLTNNVGSIELKNINQTLENNYSEADLEETSLLLLALIDQKEPEEDDPTSSSTRQTDDAVDGIVENRTSETDLEKNPEAILRISNNVGNISLEHIWASEAVIGNNVGTIELQFCDMDAELSTSLGAIEAVSHSGDLKIMSEVGAVEVQAHQGGLIIYSDLGSMDIDLKSMDSDKEYTFSSEAGSIELNLPGGLDPVFNIDSDLGSVENKYDDRSGGIRPGITINSNLGAVEIR